jgi:hypothetical protein
MAMASRALRRAAAVFDGPDPVPDSDHVLTYANSETATDARSEFAEQVTTALAVVVAMAAVLGIAMLLGTT